MPKFSSRAVASCAAILAMMGAARSAPFTHFDFRLPPLASTMESGSMTVAPLPFVKFCMVQSAECRGGSGDQIVSINADTYAALAQVNRSVNANIRPMAKAPVNGIDDWAINPDKGDCNDYAVTKRHELMKLGMPASALLLAAARTGWGEGHLVLIVRTDRGDYVLDNLTSQIRPWNATGYRWLKRQSAENPQFWTTVGKASRPQPTSARARGRSNPVQPAVVAPAPFSPERDIVALRDSMI